MSKLRTMTQEDAREQVRRILALQFPHLFPPRQVNNSVHATAHIARLESHLAQIGPTRTYRQIADPAKVHLPKADDLPE
jgi:hypothetical protein